MCNTYSEKSLNDQNFYKVTTPVWKVLSYKWTVTNTPESNPCGPCLSVSPFSQNNLYLCSFTIGFGEFTNII